MIKKIPNILTISRLILAIIIIILCILNFFWSALLVSIVAALTDVYDGIIARKFKVTSKTGSILDPIADKGYILIITIFVFISYDYYDLFRPIFNFWILLTCLRNISQLSAIPILKIAKKKFKVKPKPFAKWGTVLSFIIISLFIFYLALKQNADSNIINGNFVFMLEYFPKNKELINNFIFNYTKITLVTTLLPSCIFEIWILITFIPRFIQILLGKHDTFN